MKFALAKPKKKALNKFFKIKISNLYYDNLHIKCYQ